MWISTLNNNKSSTKNLSAPNRSVNINNIFKYLNAFKSES